MLLGQLQEKLEILETQLAEMEQKSEMKHQEIEKRNNVTFSSLHKQNIDNTEQRKY